MDTILQQLHDNFDSSGSEKKAKNVIGNLTTLLAKDIESIEPLIVSIFHESYGILAFIKKSIWKKQFHSTTKNAIEIIHTLVLNFPQELSEHIYAITNTCLSVVKSKCSPYAVQKALLVLELIIEKKVIDGDEIRDVFDTIYGLLNYDSSETVTEKYLDLIGSIAQFYPEVIENEWELQTFLIKLLRVSVDDRNPRQQTISGIFSCFRKFLTGFQLHPDCKQYLYQTLQQYSNYIVETHRKGVYRAALKLLEKHMNIFSAEIFNDRQTWTTRFRPWLNSSNHDDLKAGYGVLYAFYKELGKVLQTPGEEYQSALKILLTTFQEDAMDKSTLKLSVKVMGYLVAALKINLPEELSSSFLLLLNRVQFNFLRDIESCENSLDILPDFIDTLSAYCLYLEDFSPNHAECLQRISVLIIRLFPKVSNIHHGLVINSLIRTFSRINNCQGYTLKAFLQDVIYQGVLWTCSHNIIEEVGNSETTHETYVPLWKGLLNDPELQKPIFNELIKVLLIQIMKLNLDIKRVDEPLAAMDPALVYNPVHPPDQIIFVNLVNLYVELLDSSQPNLLKKWFPFYTKHILKKSQEHPLISGFYKLLAVALKVSDKLNYFSNESELNSTFENVIMRIMPMTKQYKGDLQLSLIQVILSTPTILINNINADYTPIFVTVFAVGRTNLKIAEMGVETLQRWFREMPQHKTKLMKMLPMLDTFLRTQAVIGVALPSLETRKTLKPLEKRKVVVDSESPLARLQRKILCFIGEMSGEMCYEFVKYDLGQVIWEEKPILKVALPYHDNRIKLYLDKFVPRTLELAIYCSNRKIKFTACELFHSLVMIYLGEKTTSKKLFQKLSHGSLVLGCDEDLDVQKLFSPLCMQLMHYYSSKGLLTSTETDIILETLFEGISNANDVKLRDFCGQCLKEFVLWTNKQHSKTNNLDKIIDTLKYFSIHPDPSKRLGATLIFNNIYVELRENEHYLNLYWLDLLHNFISSAEMLQEGDYIDQVYLCLDRLMRVLVEKKDFFKTKNGNRRIPKELKDGNIQDIADFFLGKTSSYNGYCRKKCMELFLTIDPRVRTQGVVNNSDMFFRKYMHHLLKNDDIRNCTSTEESYKWLESMKCLLEGYTFVLTNKLLHEVDYDTSQIFVKVDNLLKYILASATQGELKSKSSSIFESLIEFYHALLQHSHTECFATETFYEFISTHIFNFNSIKPTFMDEFFIKISKPKIEELTALLKRRIHDIKNPPRLEPPKANSKLQKDLIRGLLTLQKTKLKEEINDLISDYFQDDIKKNLTIQKNFNESSIEYYELLLELTGSKQCFDVFAIICNANMYVDPETGRDICFGYYIFKTFQNILTGIILKHFKDYLLVAVESTMPIINIYYVIIDTISTENKEYFDSIIECITNQWNRLQILFDKDFGLAVELLVKLNRIGKINNEILFNWAVDKIGDVKQFSGEEKINFVYRLVKILGLVVPVGKCNNLRTSLDILKNECTEIFEHNIVATTLMISKLFEAARISNSIEVLRLALCIYATSKHNVEIREVYTLSLNVENKISSSLKREIITEIFEMTLNKHYDQKSRIILTKYLSHLIETTTSQTFEEFYTEHIRDLLETLKYTPLDEEDYTRKISYFILIETLCFRIDQSKFISKTCPITRAAISQPLKDGKELLKTLLKISRDVSKENPPENENLKESFRLYQCFAYNTLIYLICNTQTSMDIYKILFKNQENNLWLKIINPNVTYAFLLDVEQQPKYLQKFLHIRSENPVELSGKYLESQHLFDSTLSEDICRYDFSDVTVRSEKVIPKMSIELCEEDLNKHECMEAICGLLKTMSLKNLMPANKVPTWVYDLKKLLMDNTTLRNIKFFFGQVFVNTAEEIKVYGNVLIGPILKLASSLESINSLFFDLMFLIEVWSDVEINDEDKEYASGLIKFLMQNSYDESRAKFKKNLQFLKILVERWKGCFVVPYDVVLQKLKCSSESKELELGIQIVNILLINEITPWENTMKDFTKALINTLTSSRRNIYTFAAETIGQTLYFIQKHEIFNKNFQRIYKLIVDQLKTHVPKDSVFDCLEGIGKYFPQICDEFMGILLSKDFLSIQGSLKCTYLKICYGRLESFQEFNGFSKIDINALLEDYNEDVQIITLEMINKSLEYLCTYERALLRIVIKKLATLTNHKSTTFRNIMYEILIFFYKKFSASNEEEDLLDLSREILLKGLKEKELELETQIFNFWSENPEIPKDFNHRLTHLLSNMYYTSTQDIFLGYNSKILLNIFSKSLEYNENIYTNALIPNTQYEKCDFTTNWRTQTMSPMFASQTSGYIKATQDLVFQPTLASKRSSYLLTQVDGPSIRETFVDPNYVKISIRKKPGQRFLKNKQEISKGHAYREIKKIEKKKEIRKDLSAKKETGITVYRSYRYGDFPDIQINLSAVLKPLEVLANDDVNICRLLYCSLFDSAYEISRQKGETDTFFREIGTAINNIFKADVEFDPGLINSLLEIAIKYKKYINFKPDVITSVSQNSGLMSLGCLLLEEYLIEEIYNNEPTKAKKIKGATNDLESLHWIKLAELYKSLEDWDMVHGIFSKMKYDQAGLLEKIRNAFSLENQCSWRKAKNIYTEILTIDENEDRKDFYYVSYFNCLAELSEWKEVSKSIEQIVPAENIWEDLWSVPWNKDKLLPHYITSKLRSYLTDFNLNNEFMKRFKNLEKEDLQRKEYLLCNHAEELAFLGIVDGETTLSKMYLETFIKNFLFDWNHINPLFTSLRAKKLMSVRSCMDINHFAANSAHLNINILKDIAKYWERTSVENMGSIVQIDIRNFYRKEFANILRKKMRKNETLENVVSKMDIALIECAIQQGNHYVAEKCFQQLTEPSKCKLLHSKILFLRDKTNTTGILQSLEYLEKYLQTLNMTNELDKYLSAILYQNELITAASKSSISNAQVVNSLPVSMALLLKPPSNIDELGEQLLRRCAKVCEENSSPPINLLSEAYHKLANYAKNQKNIESLLSFAFKAIKYGSVEAKLLFPYLLEVITDEDVQQFVDESSNIPNWMFIQWIPQMFAELYTGKAKAVSKILLNIAKEYPFSVQYSFRVSRQKFVLPESIDMDEKQNFVIEVCNELESLLMNQEIDDLLEGMGSVFLPLVALDNAVVQLIKALETSVESFQKVSPGILDALYGKQYDYKNIYSARGKIFESLQKYENRIKKICQDDGNSIGIIEKLKQLRDEISKNVPPRSDDLGSYSPRLKNYKGSEIEIPGQYKGNGKPLPQYHVKISGFSSKVKVMASIRKPIAISILGSDTKEYNFLIKCGEDLRQDQRIQQLFNLMNDIINSDPICLKRNLNIVTYEVIPLTCNLGIIELVSDVKLLNDFFAGQNAKISKIHQNVCSEFGSYTKSHSNNFIQLYENVALKVDSKKARDMFKSYVQQIPWDTLRKSFHNMSVDLENLFRLRHTFIKSYSVMCLSNWLLGIGDRHLKNILISTKTGEAIGIDFGQAFGFGVQSQLVPELVPFRLTPQIVNLMKPQKMEGTFQETMAHALRALRKKTDILLATMDIFIKEPTLGWVGIAEENIQFARRKLNGDHSRIIMADELKCRKKGKEEVLEKYLEYVRGERDVEEMEVDGEMYGLSVENQIKGLLEHAVDENLLLRVFYGWNPWL